MHLGKNLLLWKSKDKKCCLYETLYATAPIWVLSDISVKFSALCTTSYRLTYKSRFFFWFTSDKFLKRPVSSNQDSYMKFLRGGLRAKVVPERTTYCITWGVPQRVPSSVSASRLRSDVPSWAKASGTPKIKMTNCKNGTLSDQPWLMSVAPTALLGSWVLQPIEGMTSFGTDFDMHAKWQGSIEEPNAKDFVARKVCTIEYWSARNQLEQDQVWRALGKLSKSCRQTSNNQPWFTTLEIPWGFLAWAVLCWLSRGLCHAIKCQLEEFCKEKIWFAIAQWTFCMRNLWQKAERGKKPVLILVPGSH
jgi:hypothetical protein